MDFTRIDPEVLALAGDRGTLIHSLLARHALGLWIGHDELPETWKGYFDSGRRWIDRYVVKVIAAEPEWEDPVQGYVGHPDLVAVLKHDRDNSLIDYKSGAIIHPAWRIQVAAYKALGDKAGHKIARIACLRLNKDGKAPKLDEFTDTAQRDYAVFLCCLRAWRYFNGN